jgi:competence protein ComEA
MLVGGMVAVQANEPNKTSQPAIEKIDINTANAETLAKELGGIGAKKAQAIVEYREANGPFKSLDDLKQVYGIGEKTVNKNRGKMFVRPPELKNQSGANNSPATDKPATVQPQANQPVASQPATDKSATVSQPATDKSGQAEKNQVLVNKDYRGKETSPADKNTSQKSTPQPKPIFHD